MLVEAGIPNNRDTSNVPAGVTKVEQKPATGPLYLQPGVSDLVTQLQTGTEGRQQVVTQAAADVPVAKMRLHVRLMLHALSRPQGWHSFHYSHSSSSCTTEARGDGGAVVLT